MFLIRLVFCSLSNNLKGDLDGFYLSFLFNFLKLITLFLLSIKIIIDNKAIHLFSSVVAHWPCRHV